MQPTSDNPLCWICLEDGSDEDPLRVVCGCRQRPVHTKCLARWQLQSAGRQDERYCRFCQQTLPDWRQTIVPKDVPMHTPTMAIVFENKIVRIKVPTGPEGEKEFKERICQLCGLDPSNTDLDVSFEFAAPTDGSRMQLSGMSSFGAAIHCAAINAGQRKLARLQRQQQQQRSRSHEISLSSLGLDDPPPAAPAAVPRGRSPGPLLVPHPPLSPPSTTTSPTLSPLGCRSPPPAASGSSAGGFSGGSGAHRFHRSYSDSSNLSTGGNSGDCNVEVGGAGAASGAAGAGGELVPRLPPIHVRRRPGIGCATSACGSFRRHSRHSGSFGLPPPPPQLPNPQQQQQQQAHTPRQPQRCADQQQQRPRHHHRDSGSTKAPAREHPVVNFLRKLQLSPRTSTNAEPCS